MTTRPVGSALFPPTSLRPETSREESRVIAVTSETTRTGAAAAQPWPELPLSAWADTRDTFHMWTQVVGKIRLALEPMVNHWWQVPLYVSARGLTTSLMHAGNTGVEIEFDLVTHRLEFRSTDGASGHVTLKPRSVASFYGATMALVEELGVEVR